MYLFNVTVHCFYRSAEDYQICLAIVHSKRYGYNVTVTRIG
jgi:hypothetical protein